MDMGVAVEWTIQAVFSGEMPKALVRGREMEPVIMTERVPSMNTRTPMSQVNSSAPTRDLTTLRFLIISAVKPFRPSAFSLR